MSEFSPKVETGTVKLVPTKQARKLKIENDRAEWQEGSI